MTAIKPRSDHPWRQAFLIRREVNEHIKKSGINPSINNYKVGGGRPTWNGRK
ncbi:hypothetical protein NDK47_17875 [Brevibacillus ruminantium]|uniref:Uncharacterized protein n=1 Tax=Brevibacillus ruminantium TaxID=2950604 RepID=A0ABY4WB81_9BACL|nr:hypothetical protein [Brevibacillus ruminantium]USG64019.1 hypothetical protein NDK47_17875 [Brevibacillus ruminantium]